MHNTRLVGFIQPRCYDACEVNRLISRFYTDASYHQCTCLSRELPTNARDHSTKETHYHTYYLVNEERRIAHTNTTDASGGGFGKTEERATYDSPYGGTVVLTLEQTAPFAQMRRNRDKPREHISHDC